MTPRNLVIGIAVLTLCWTGSTDLAVPDDSGSPENVPGTGWSQWRGSLRDGLAAGPAWPADFAGLKRLWRVELGKGYPGPVIAGTRVFSVETLREDESVAVRALDRATGKELWRTTWSSRGDVPFFARDNGDWVRSTPAVDSEMLYVGDMQEVLRALDVENGNVRWILDFPHEFATNVPDFGFASSPLLAGDSLYVQAANSLVKVDRSSGEVVWRALQGVGGMAASGAFSSPILADLAGRNQIVVLTRHKLHGVDPDSGDVLWSHPVPNFRGMNIVTPVVIGDSIFTSPYKNGSFMLRVREVDGTFSVEESWNYKGWAYMSSPIVVDGHLYLHLGNQRLDCIDIATGRSRWRSSDRFGKYWSMVHRGDRILALDSGGKLLLLQANTEKLELLDARKVSDEETWGHLAVSGDELFVRELEGLSAYRWSPAGGSVQPGRRTGS